MSSSSLTVYQEVELPVSPALLYNNLVTHRNGDYISYASPTSIVSIQTATGTPCFRPLLIPADTYVHFLAGVSDPSIENIILVAALANRTATVVVNGQECQTVTAKGSTEGYTCTAAARIPHTEEMLVILGGSEGTVEALRYTLQGQPTASVAVPSVPVQAHERHSLTALDVEVLSDSAESTELVSGDAAGHVVLWKGGSPVQCVAPAAASDAVTAVKFMTNTPHVAVAYGGGQIHVVQRASGAVSTVIQAHARWINAMAYHGARQLLTSAAEDGQIFVWDTNAANPNDVCVARGNTPNELPTGAAIIGTHNVVVQLSYDVSKLRLLSY